MSEPGVIPIDLDSPFGKTACAGMGAGWPQVLARIAPALAAYDGS
jgi:hypothetical protein